MRNIEKSKNSDLDTLDLLSVSLAVVTLRTAWERGDDGEIQRAYQELVEWLKARDERLSREFTERRFG